VCRELVDRGVWKKSRLRGSLAWYAVKCTCIPYLFHTNIHTYIIYFVQRAGGWGGKGKFPVQRIVHPGAENAVFDLRSRQVCASCVTSQCVLQCVAVCCVQVEMKDMVFPRGMELWNLSGTQKDAHYSFDRRISNMRHAARSQSFLTWWVCMIYFWRRVYTL